jgi:UDP-sulfoquinovose synthase
VKIWNLNNKTEIKTIIGDLLNHRFVSDLLADCKPDAIIHYAEQPSAPYSMSSRERAVFTQHNNVIGNLNLIFAIKKNCPNVHLIKLGTLGEYGTPNIDIEEGWLEITHNGRKDKMLYPKKPGSFYHLSKVHDSANLEFACRIWGLKCTDLNQGVVYGNLTSEIEEDFENLCTSFHYDEIFGTIINRFISQAVTNFPLSLYGTGNQRRGFLNLIDTIKCVEIAVNNPAKEGEFRVFNQFTDFLSLNEMADLVIKASSDLKIKATKKNIPNPRKEMEEHYYNPKNTSLISLGLKPIQFNLETIKKNIRIIEKYKFNINQNYFNPTVKWEN